MKTLLLTVALVVGLGPTAALAQEKRDFKTAKFSWTWTADVDGPPTHFELSCGKAPGQYTIHKLVPAAEREMFMRDLIKGNGVYYCAFRGVNDFGTGDWSNEENFQSGARPSSVGVLTIK
jgi:hypothetical protein